MHRSSLFGTPWWSLLLGGLATLTILGPAEAFQDRILVTPGMPGTADHHLNWKDLKLEWGLGFDLRSSIGLGGDERDGSLASGLRAVDLALKSDFHRELWGFAMVSAEDDELSLSRAALVYTGLGGSSYLRVGRFAIDFGKQMQARPYELPYPNRPYVLREYLGDQVHATGISYGDILATSRHSTLRVSIGLYAGYDRGDNPLPTGTSLRPTLELRSSPRLDELALGARVSGVVDVGPEGMFQWGLSAQGLPDYGLVGNADDGTELGLSDQSQWVYGLDLTFGHADEVEGPSWSFGWEGLLATGDVGGSVTQGPNPLLETQSGDFFGQFLWVERRTRSGRALGAVFSQHERPLAGDPLAFETSLYFSRPLIENSLLRFAVRHRDAEGEEASQAILVQFVALAGSLGHALDW